MILSANVKGTSRGFYQIEQENNQTTESDKKKILLRAYAPVPPLDLLGVGEGPNLGWVEVI